MATASKPESTRSGNAKSSSAQRADKGEHEHDEEQPYEENEDFVHQLFGVVPAWFVSLVVHSILILILMFVTLTGPDRKVVELMSVVEEEEVLEQVTEIELEVPEEMELEESTAKAEAVDVVADINSFEIPDSDALETVADLSSQFEGFDSLVHEGELDGIADVEAAGETVFFGTKAVATRVMFVVDNSNSMGGGKLETALIEMQRAINSLSPKQKFYIIFYSDTAYPLFYPDAVSQMVPATDGNKQKVMYWLSTIQMCLRTDVKDALIMAERLKPDLMYILGDGAFTDRPSVSEKLAANPIKGLTIHTLGMNVQPKDQKDFRLIALKHNGKYKDVGISDLGRQQFKKTGGRPRNSSRGLVWGVKLKPGPPKKKNNKKNAKK